MSERAVQHRWTQALAGRWQVPLLVLSLAVLAMGDQAEFDARVHYRTTDPADPNDPPPAAPLYVGEITRVTTGPFEGVMQMATNSSASGKHSASSVGGHSDTMSGRSVRGA